MSSQVKRSVSQNSAANFSGYIVSVIVTLFLTPVVIGTLGDSRYGIWALFGQLVGYYGLLDMGMRGALSHYITRHSAKGESDAEARSIASAFWILVLAGFVAFLIALTVAMLLPKIVDLGAVDLNEARLTIIIMSVTICLSLPTAVFHSVLVGRQRFDIINLVEVSLRVVSAIAIYLVLTNGGGLVELSIVQAFTTAATWIVMSRAAKRIAGRVELRPSWFSKTELKKLFNFGLKNSALHIAGKVSEQMDLILVGVILGIQWVTFYRIGEALVSYARDACRSLTTSFTPRLTELHAQGSMTEFEALYLKGMRLLGIFITALFVNLIIFGEDFIRLWLGDSYVSGDWEWRSSSVLIALTLCHLVKALQSISWQVLFAARKQGFLIGVVVCETAANLVLSIWLAHKIGLVGVALGALAPAYLTNLFVTPAYVLRTFGFSAKNYVLQGLIPPLLLGGAMIVVIPWVSKTLPTNSWPSFIGVTCVAGAITALLAFLIGLRSDERSMVLSRLWKSPG